MDVLIPAFVIIAIVMAGMAVGVMFSRQPIQGTCGGLGNMRDEHGEPMCECGPAGRYLCRRRRAKEGRDDAVTAPR